MVERVPSTKPDKSTGGLDPMLTKREVADTLRVDPATVDRERKHNPKFPEPTWITDKTPRWFRSQIINYLASRPKGGISPDWTKTRASDPPHKLKTAHKSGRR
jgi:predicted DNA-binding transcriptional regulator AlpA